jgi:hypothetical protein
MWGYDAHFTTRNYGLTTTPAKEYEIVICGEQCSEEDILDKKTGKRVRVIRKFGELKQLTLCQHAGLTTGKDEILAKVYLLSNFWEKMFQHCLKLQLHHAS